MNIFSWLTNRFSNQSKALLLYKRGMAKAKKHDRAGAIVDYTASIGVPDTSDDVKAMALYNRALVHVAAGDEQQGIDDLEAVLAMDESPVNIKTMARGKLDRMDFRSHKGKA